MINLTVERFNDLYWGEKLSYRLMAKRLSVGGNALRSWMHKHRKLGNIKTRSREEAIRVAAREGRYDHAGINNPGWVDGRSTEEGKHRCYNYGITQKAYDKLLEDQNGTCGICKEVFFKTPHIDHDHGTGSVRGLLCRSCNHGLGGFRDNAESLKNAINYLNKARWDNR